MRLGLHLGLSGKPGDGIDPPAPVALWSDPDTWAGTLPEQQAAALAAAKGK